MSSTSKVSTSTMTAAASARLSNFERGGTTLQRLRVDESNFGVGVGPQEENVRYDREEQTVGHPNRPDPREPFYAYSLGLIRHIGEALYGEGGLTEETFQPVSHDLGDGTRTYEKNVRSYIAHSSNAPTSTFNAVL